MSNDKMRDCLLVKRLCKKNKKKPISSIKDS